MKRVLICLLFLCFIFKSYAQKEDCVFVNNLYTDYVYLFEKLSIDEILTYEFEYFQIDGKDYTLKIFAENELTSETRLIGNWYVPYGAYQIAQDRRSAVFFIDILGTDYRYPLFLIDGVTGIVNYLVNISLLAMTNKNLEYLLVPCASDEPGKLNMVLIDIKTMKMIRHIEWTMNERLGGGLTIYRSIDSNYDFRIDYKVESNLYATAYYKIDGNIFDELFNESYLLYEREYPRGKVLPKELGW